MAKTVSQSCSTNLTHLHLLKKLCQPPAPELSSAATRQELQFSALRHSAKKGIQSKTEP